MRILEEHPNAEHNDVMKEYLYCLVDYENFITADCNLRAYTRHTRCMKKMRQKIDVYTKITTFIWRKFQLHSHPVVSPDYDNKSKEE